MVLRERGLLSTAFSHGQVGGVTCIYGREMSIQRNTLPLKIYTMILLCIKSEAKKSACFSIERQHSGLKVASSLQDLSKLVLSTPKFILFPFSLHPTTENPLPNPSSNSKSVRKPTFQRHNPKQACLGFSRIETDPGAAVNGDLERSQRKCFVSNHPKLEGNMFCTN